MPGVNSIKTGKHKTYVATKGCNHEAGEYKLQRYAEGKPIC